MPSFSQETAINGVKDLIQRNEIGNGAVEAVDDQSVRTGELYNPQAGETIHVLEDSPVQDVLIRRGGTAKYKVVYGYETTTGAPRQIPVNSFVKNLQVVDAGGHPVLNPDGTRKRLMAKGTVHDWMIKNNSVKRTGELLRGHDIKYNEPEAALTLVFGSTVNTQTSHAVNADFVGEVPAND